MVRKKIVFFPIEAGLAHITRSLAVAEELKASGHTVIFALPKGKEKLVAQENFEIITIPPCMKEADVASFADLTDRSYVKSLADSERAVLQKIQPDIAVVDFRLSAIVSCATFSIPTAYLTHSDGLPFPSHTPNMGWPKLLNGIFEPLNSRVSSYIKKPYMDTLVAVAKTYGNFNFDSLFANMLYIIPEPEGYLPTKNKSYHIEHVGPIFWQGFEASRPRWLNKLKPNGKTVYLTFGGTGFDGNKLIDLSRYLLSNGYTVVVSTSTIADIEKFPKNNNLFVEKFLPGFEVVKHVDLVVCHGGYGTMMQAVLGGAPVIAIPFQPDQLIHAFRFQELGLGRCTVNMSFSMIRSLLKRDWKGILRAGSNIPNKKIGMETQKVLQEKDKYSKRIKEFYKTLAPQNSAKKAARLIEAWT